MIYLTLNLFLVIQKTMIFPIRNLGLVEEFKHSLCLITRGQKLTQGIQDSLDMRYANNDILYIITCLYVYSDIE